MARAITGEFGGWGRDNLSERRSGYQAKWKVTTSLSVRASWPTQRSQRRRAGYSITTQSPCPGSVTPAAPPSTSRTSRTRRARWLQSDLALLACALIFVDRKIGNKTVAEFWRGDVIFFELLLHSQIVVPHCPDIKIVNSEESKSNGIVKPESQVPKFKVPKSRPKGPGLTQ